MTAPTLVPRTPEQQAELDAALLDLFQRRITFNQTLGLQIQSVQPGDVRATFDMRPELVGHYAHGRLHGGVISATLDHMGGLAIIVGIAARHPHDTVQQVMARFTKNSLHFDRVAIFKDQASAYSVGLADAFRASFTALGGTIVNEQAYRAGETHFSAQLGSLIAQSPQAIFVPGYYTEVALIAREARGQGFTGRFLGGDGWSGPSITQNDDDKLVGDFFSDGFAPEGATSPVARTFVQKYRERYHTDPNGLAALGYDAALVLFDAIRRANSTDGARLRAALATTRGVHGATGDITLNAQRDAVKNAVILRVTESGFRYHQTVEPQ